VRWRSWIQPLQVKHVEERKGQIHIKLVTPSRFSANYIYSSIFFSELQSAWQEALRTSSIIDLEIAYREPEKPSVDSEIVKGQVH
jgi:hypothetical protein